MRKPKPSISKTDTAPSKAPRCAFSNLSSRRTVANIQDTIHRQSDAEEDADNAWPSDGDTTNTKTTAETNHTRKRMQMADVPQEKQTGRSRFEANANIATLAILLYNQGRVFFLQLVVIARGASGLGYSLRA